MNQNYIIQVTNVEVTNTDDDVARDIEEKVLRHARGLKSGRTDIDVFEEFAVDLEYAFGAEISTFSATPSDIYDFWEYNLPYGKNFDVATSRIIVFFHIIKWTDIVNILKGLLSKDFPYLEYDDGRSERLKGLCVKVRDDDETEQRDFCVVKAALCANLEHKTGLKFMSPGIVTNAGSNPLLDWTWFHIRVDQRETRTIL